METNMEYTQHNNSTGTSNIDHIFEDWCKQQLFVEDTKPLKDFLRKVKSHQLKRKLGNPSINAFTRGDLSSGYGHEWYYTTPQGNTIGIGFRWGQARIRGQQSLVTTDEVIDFIQWLSQPKKRKKKA